jgi:hypothetical protein
MSEPICEHFTPLEWMLSVIRDDDADVKRRDEMAKAAAPYMHPRLSAVEYVGKDEGPIHPHRRTDHICPGRARPRPSVAIFTEIAALAGGVQAWVTYHDWAC